MTANTHKRYLGGLELYSQVRNHHDLYTTVLITATFNNPLEKDVLYAALAQVVTEEPYLRVNVDFDTDGRPYFRPLPMINLDEVVSFVEGDMSRELLTSLHEEKLVYANENPLWKIIVIGQNELAFVFDHSCFDGLSGSIILQRLTFALNKNLPALTRSVLMLPTLEMNDGETRSIVPPSLEELAPTIPSIWRALVIISNEILKFFRNEFFSLVGYHRGYTFTGAPVPTAVYSDDDAIPVTCKWKGSYDYLDLNEDISNKLVSLGKSRNVSATSLLYAILLSVLHDEIRRYRAEEIPNPKDIGKVIIVGQCPVNARRYFRPEIINASNMVGNYVGNATSSMTVDIEGVKVDSEAFWTHALDFQAQLRSQLATPLQISMKPAPPPVLENIGMLTIIPSITSYILSKLGQAREASLEISNVGVVNTTKLESESGDSSYFVSRFRVSQSTGAISAPYKLTVVTSGKGGPLSLVLCVCEDNSSLIAKELINKIEKTIQILVEDLP